MTVNSQFRRFALAVHIVSSVGWIGALSAFLVLAVAGLAAADVETMRAAYVSMDLTTKFAIVPLAGAALGSGMLQALVTPWGLVRHYWVAFKLLIVLAATFTLVNETGRIAYLASVAADRTVLSPDLRGLRFSLLAHAIGGLAVLLWAAALAVYKPRGITPFGARKQGLEAPPRSVWKDRY